SLSLRDYPTLSSVIDFVYERATDLSREPEPVVPPPELEPEPEPTRQISSGVVGDDEAAAAIRRRIPTPRLRPDLGSCVPTGVELTEGDRVIVMVDAGGVGAALVQRLGDRGVDVLTIEGAPDADELLAQVDSWRGSDRVKGLYWLPALDVEPSLDELDLAGWREELRRRVKLLYRSLRHVYELVGTNGGFLVTATRLGGLHGYGPDGSTAPMGGGVVGLAKAFKRERPDAVVKAVDFGISRKTVAIAELLVAETLYDPGAVEIGYRDDRRHTISLEVADLPDPSTGLELGSDSVFVVTGAAGSIVSAIVADLARASGGTFHLLDLVPEPDPADPDLIAFDTDRDGLMRTIFERLSATGERATPVMVESELARIERSHAALSALQAVAANGGTAHYHSVNLLDGAAMADVTDAVGATSGKVDVLIHAGGLEISRLLPDKEPAEYDLVFDVKADGWFNLMKGLASVPIGATVAFSSIAGRFGNGGQTDYSAANDLLCKLTSNLRVVRPDTVGLAIDWTAWGDIGMATRGSIPTVMAAAGIDMLPAAAGIPIVRRELNGDASTREVLVGVSLGSLGDEWHPTGGLDTSALAETMATHPLLDEAEAMTVAAGLVVTATLDPAEEPFLDDHRIDGTPVLPGVMGIELFAEVAGLLFADLDVVAIEDVDFLAPFKFYRDEPRSLRIEAQYRSDGDDLVADCRLIGERTLANQDAAQRTVHFTGRARLASAPPELGSAELPPHPREETVEAEDIYQIYFHGPAYQVMSEAWQAEDAVVGRMASGLPADHRPFDVAMASAPRLTELCFQTAGVWEIGMTGAMALPMHIDRVTSVTGDEPSGTTHAVVRPVDDGSFDAVVVDDHGRVVVELAGYRTVPLPATLEAGEIAALQNAMGAAP
ncbi:MAG: SDR family NAD(P)-dependent oxidoreductase, partial [Acidimicrobiia bacterium]|nr:SDR family NAD(P)-dependent oxidoreductase [Acidimicrobiia bacterium]